MKQDLELDGVAVDLKTCDHCLRNPSTEEVEEALRRAQEERNSPRCRCAYCGKPIKVVRYSIQHYSGKWSACEVEVEPALSINQIYPQNGPPICDNNALHLGCVLKSMPFINGFKGE